MKKTYSRIIILLVCIQIIACSHKKDGATNNMSEDEPYHINLPETGEDEIVVSKIAKKIEYIPLETTEKSFFNFGRLHIEIEDSFVVISDKDKILVFNKKGKFIRKIGKTGKGPGEFVRVIDMTLLEDTFYITSTGVRTITKYNMDGNFINTIPNLQLKYFTSTTDCGFVWYNWEKGNIVYFDNNFNATDTLQVEHDVSPIKANSMINFPKGEKCFFKYKNKLLFNNYLNDTIWDVTNKRKEPFMVFNLKEKLLPSFTPEDLSDESQKKFHNLFNDHELLKVAMGDTLILINRMKWNVELPEDESLYTYNKVSSEIKRSKTGILKDDLHGGVELYPNQLCDNKIISFIFYNQIKWHYDNADNNNDKMFWTELHEKVSDRNSNPILVILELK